MNGASKRADGQRAAQLHRQIPDASGIPCASRVCFVSGLASFLS